MLFNLLQVADYLGTLRRVFVGLVVSYRCGVRKIGLGVWTDRRWAPELRNCPFECSLLRPGVWCKCYVKVTHGPLWVRRVECAKVLVHHRPDVGVPVRDQHLVRGLPH